MAQHLKMTKKELEEVKTIKWYKTWRWQNKNLKKLRLSNGRKHEDDKKRTWRSKDHQMAQYMKMTKKNSIWQMYDVTRLSYEIDTNWLHIGSWKHICSISGATRIVLQLYHPGCHRTLRKFLIHITCVGGHIEGLVWWTIITVLDKKPSCFQGSCVFFFALCCS